MAAATITPIIWIAGTAVAMIPGTIVPAGEEWSVDVRVANATGAEIQYRLGFGNQADIANGLYRHFDIKIPANESRDVELKLTLPAGWRLFDRCSAAAAAQVSITGRKRAV